MVGAARGDHAMLEAAAAGLASFIFVFLKAFQQRNVAFDKYLWVLPLSLSMAATEVYVVHAIATVGWDLAMVGFIGFGGGTGAMIAMYLHHHIFKERT